MFVTSVCIKTLISVSDTQNIVGEDFLYMVPLDCLRIYVCYLLLPKKKCHLLQLMLVGAAIDVVEACAVSWWCK